MEYRCRRHCRCHVVVVVDVELFVRLRHVFSGSTGDVREEVDFTVFRHVTIHSDALGAGRVCSTNSGPLFVDSEYVLANASCALCVVAIDRLDVGIVIATSDVDRNILFVAGEVPELHVN